MASAQHTVEQVARMLGVSTYRIKMAATRAGIVSFPVSDDTYFTDKEIAKINEKL